MCKFKLFSIAAAALMMVACSNEDLTQQTQTKAGKMQFSATIAAPSSGATTRTIYTEDTQNKKITVAWKVDDEIALVHNGVKDVATVKTINSDGSATITGYVTGATNNANVRLVYPAARVGTVTGGADGTEYTADETVEGKLKTQDGTLAYIQDNLDFREDMGQLAVSETGVTLAEKAGDISPLLAIWKLTLSDGTNNLSATQVKIKGGESVLASTTTLTAGTSVVTLAMPTNLSVVGALTIEATVGDDTYAYTKAEGATFNPGTYYQSTVTMAKASAEITVTITQNDLPPTGNKSFTKDGVTVTANDMIPSGNTILGPGSFTTTLGNFTKIEVTGDTKPTGTGWTSGVWTGNASTVEFTGSIDGFMSGAFTIVCTIQPAEATTVNLSNLTADYEAQNGETLTGTLDAKVQISIAAGATVTLDDVTINGENNARCKWAGITCEGDATIILKDGSTNTVKGFYQNYPGIYVPENKTLTIKGETAGTGKLTASSNGWGAGIGGGYGIACGNIIIEGGTITATGGSNAAGIGSGSGDTCSDITISGGTVTATGGDSAAGIGSGNNAGCGDIKITSGVTKVTAKKGGGAPNSIGKGKGRGASCGTVTIGGTVYWDGSAYQNGGDSYLINDIVYPTPFANVTASDLGKVIGADGNIYADATAAEAASTTAVAVICYVGDAGTADASSATYKGLALALEDANSGNQVAWCSQSIATCLAAQYDDVDAAKGDMAGIANTDALVGHATHTTHAAASAARGYNSGTHPTGTSAWFLPSAGQWEKMIDAAGNYSTLITRASLKSDDNYWSSSELSSLFAWRYDGIYGSGWGQDSKDISRYVRACLAF